MELSGNGAAMEYFPDFLGGGKCRVEIGVLVAESSAGDVAVKTFWSTSQLMT
jgi:hypothetical protein